MPSRILVVEDDADIARLLTHSLAKEGFSTRWINNGTEVVAETRKYKPGVVLLDLILPGLSGIDVCRLLRRDEAFAGAIIIVTARAEEADRIVGLELGADDYVTKPFSMRELIARIRARLRSATPHKPASSSIECGNLVVDTAGHRAVVDGRNVELSPIQFRLLHFFVSHPSEAFSRDEIIRRVWGQKHGPAARAIDVFVRQLRRKIENEPNNPVYLKTLPRVGYMFSPPDQV